MRFRPLYLAFLFLILLAACVPAPKADPGSGLQVTVTFNAMEEFAKAVGGDLVTIHSIIPPGVEPHNFEPRSQDLMLIQSSDVLIYNGAGMEPWLEDVLKAVDPSKLLAVNASSGADLIPASEEPAHSAEDSHGHDQGVDPHLWLSLKQAAVEAGNIKDAFIQADPANKAAYESNYQDFTQQLEALYNEYKPKFDAAPSKFFVTGHAAFGYFCRDFGLQQLSVEGLFAEGEPTVKQLSDLIEFSKEHKVTTIFTEALVSPAISETLAKEVGAKVVPIYTISSSEDDLSYLERMKLNLERVYAALQ